MVVCPTESIWVGDLDDPNSGISQFLNTNQIAVRAPEQNTGPNVFYLGADRAVLDPLAAPVDAPTSGPTPTRSGCETRADCRPTRLSNARTTLNTAHPGAVGLAVSTYLWTKGVGGRRDDGRGARCCCWASTLGG